MRIGIDCRLAGHRHAGIGRYIANLVTRLPQLAPGQTWVLFFYDQDQATEVSGQLPPANVEIQIVPIRHYSWAEQLRLPGIFRRAKLDLLHVPHFNIPLLYTRPLVVTIHDLLWHEYKGTHVTTLSPLGYWFKYVMYRWITTQAVKRARAILVPAQTIRRTVSKYYPRVAAKIVVTKEGILPAKSVTKRTASRQSSAATAHSTTPKTLLYIGSLYPHKNLKLVIEALTQLPDYRLVLVGSRTVFQDKIVALIKNYQVEKQVELVGYVSDEELSTYWHTATALVQPSLSEGFGLTGVEAMSQGLPVLASNIPIFNEIYKNAAIYFDPHQVNSFVKAVKVLETTDRQKLIARGYKVTATYSWDSMAQTTWQVYQSVLKLV